MEADTLVETLAATQAEAECVTFGDTLGKVKTEALVDNLPQTIKMEEKKTLKDKSLPRHWLEPWLTRY